MNCYFCGQPNGCEVEKQAKCWCMHIEIPTALLTEIPEAERDKACICRKCVEKSHNSG